MKDFKYLIPRKLWLSDLKGKQVQYLYGLAAVIGEPAPGKMFLTYTTGLI